MQQRRNNNRPNRINEAIKEEMASILRAVKDPRIGIMTSVIKVDTSRDLNYCKIYYSVLGDEDERKKTKEGLVSAAGFIRRELALRLNLRQTPELTFIEDDSIEYSIYLSEKLKKIHEEDEQRKPLMPELMEEMQSENLSQEEEN